MFLMKIDRNNGGALPVSALRPLFRGIGTVTFADSLLETMNHVAVFDHCTAFEFFDVKPPTLIGMGSYGPTQRVMRATLAYVGGLHVDEPVRRTIGDLGEQLLVRYHERSELPHSDWRHVCYEATEINDRLSVAAKTDDNHWFVANFFRDNGRQKLTDNDLQQACGLAVAVAMAGQQHAALGRAGSDGVRGMVDASKMPTLEQLSERENQVCRLIVTGFSTSEIAEQLDVLESSVSTYRKRAYAKLQINSRRELMQLYRTQKIASTPPTEQEVVHAGRR
ncbi:helix-turn-helix domain-containing protein [Paraburkholderia caribensis]|uniref:helix-turn-helix domain-containing protein n=1 Tax=Paraburkholderia caribensis TaxID=75105 RepID=UPI001CABF954|nr:helix-turn-helix transcriptional regulator [Paraburkholderia caribensis]CAG9263154.1 Response regulator containing a CheY-like receiver domain and an HTH DNA-binding domain [Paraburkholderia caribensis]